MDWYYEKEGNRNGPKSLEELRELLTRGDISNETLVWNNSFGRVWKSVRDTDLIDQQSGSPPPLPAAAVSSFWVTILALLPVAGPIIERAFGDLAPNVDKNSTAVIMIYIVANSIFCLADAGSIERSGRNIKGIKLRIWFLLVPVYLLQRARALRQPFTFLWVWIAAAAAGIYIQDPNIFSGPTYWGYGIPACNSSFASGQVKSVFKDISRVRAVGVHALELSGQGEQSMNDGVRTCYGIITASNADQYKVTYTLKEQGDQIFTYVTLTP